MTIKFPQYVLLALAGGLAFIGAPAQAQQRPSDLVPITGGRAIFTGGAVIVPNSATSPDSRTLVQGSSVPSDGLVIQTTLGSISRPILFKQSTSPILNIAPGTVPSTGITGNVQGNASFRGFTASGQPALFVGVPTKLDFTISSGTFLTAPIVGTRYQTPPDYVLTTSGGVTSSGGSTTTGSAQQVFVFQFQPTGINAQSQTLLGNNIPASDFSVRIPATSYPSDIYTSLTGGYVTLPTPPGFSTTSATTTSTPTTTNTNPTSNNTTGFVRTSTTYIPVFSSDNSRVGTVISTVFVPALNSQVQSESNNGSYSGRIYRLTSGGSTTYVTVGLPSRVFPGLIGIVPTPNPRPTTNPSPNPRPTTNPSPNPSPTTNPSPNPRPTTNPSPNPSPTTNPSPNPSPTTNPSPSPSPTTNPSPSPSPTTNPSPNPSPTTNPSPNPSPTTNPSPSPSPTTNPSPNPSPTTNPSPNQSPSLGGS